jgi:hypothetical protein
MLLANPGKQCQGGLPVQTVLSGLGGLGKLGGNALIGGQEKGFCLTIPCLKESMEFVGNVPYPVYIIDGSAGADLKVFAYPSFETS